MKKLFDLYKKYREGIDYLFWGGVAFLLSMFLFWLFAARFGWNEVIANTVNWVICVIFTFFTNKFFVFRSKTENAKGFIREFLSFTAARLFTLVLEDIIIWVGCTLMGYNEGIPQMVVKFIGQFVVIVTNYILSKLWIFKKKDEGADPIEQAAGETADE
ncbi:MAG: GtrA family protein [Lachnospiraceae bacterium]|nr:GtrA family protein [Lachnospiraceae bacterium]